MRCAALKRDGGRCRNAAATNSDYCSAHDPGRSEARKEAARKAGRARHGAANREVRDLKEQAKILYQEVRSGRVDPKVAAVLTQTINTLARLLGLEREWLETLVLKARVEELERLAGEERPKGGRTWA